VKEKFFKSKWLRPFLNSLAAACLAYFGTFVVDLTPKISSDFFFASDDPQMQAAKKIDLLFPGDPQVVLTATGDIRSRSYLKKIADLTDEAFKIPGVTGVNSLGAGPGSVQDALISPFWNRFLISKDEIGSNIVIFVNADDVDIPSIIELKNRYHSSDFPIAISGVPYIVHEIQNRLVSELQIFSLVAFFLFSLLVLMIYRSLWILVGSVVACTGAAFADFISLKILGVEPGILTANLWSIVFVLTLSHIVFMTGNWERLIRSEGRTPEEAVSEAVKATGPASFWAMLTTLLGFLTLVWADAKPLQQFGIAGGIGAVFSIVAAYTLFPAFLRLVKPIPNLSDRWEKKTVHFLLKEKKRIWIVPLLLFVLALPGLYFIDSDPAIFNYFSKDSKIERDLREIDRQGGISSLDVVIRDAQGKRLDTQEAYERMQSFQKEVEAHPIVGNTLSLAVLMEKASQNSAAKFLPWSYLVGMMESSLFRNVGGFFVTPDRENARFTLRIREMGLGEAGLSRAEVVSTVEKAARDQGFDPHLIGGLFYLQGQLSQLVVASVFQGILGLLLLFSVITWIISKSIRVSFALIGLLTSVPVIVFGFLGYFRFPLDIVSAPALNIAIAIGIDSMIHLLFRAKNAGKVDQLDWANALKTLWKPILTSTVIIASGFGAFHLSDFPPTQRLGHLIVFGSLLAVLLALLVVPRIRNQITEK
jgi:uncharacterized protein